MKPNEAWLDFVRQTGIKDHPDARTLFLAGFQAGLHFSERALYDANNEAVAEVRRTVLAFEDAENGRVFKA